MSKKHTPGLCVYCGKPVGPLRDAKNRTFRRSVSLSIADPQGLFCKMRCAMTYGIRAARLDLFSRPYT